MGHDWYKELPGYFDPERASRNVKYENELHDKDKDIEVLDLGVAQGLAKSKYIIPKRKGWANRPAADRIETGDRKFEMYANALPAAIRKKVVAEGYDVRALYTEYRLIGKDGMVAKYGSLPDPKEETDD